MKTCCGNTFLTASSDEGILISQYAYTPSSQRIHRLTYEVPEYGVEESNTWWSYDQGRRAEAYNGDLSPRRTYGEGPTPGEHLFQADWSADQGNPVSATHYFIQVHNESVVQLRDPSCEFEESREYGYFGVLTRFDPETGTPFPDQNDSNFERGYAGKEEMFELRPIKSTFPFWDPKIGKELICKPSLWRNSLVSLGVISSPLFFQGMVVGTWHPYPVNCGSAAPFRGDKILLVPSAGTKNGVPVCGKKDIENAKNWIKKTLDKQGKVECIGERRFCKKRERCEMHVWWNNNKKRTRVEPVIEPFLPGEPPRPLCRVHIAFEIRCRCVDIDEEVCPKGRVRKW